ASANRRSHVALLSALRVDVSPRETALTRRPAPRHPGTGYLTSLRSSPRPMTGSSQTWKGGEEEQRAAPPIPLIGRVLRRRNAMTDKCRSVALPPGAPSEYPDVGLIAS